VSKPLVVLPRPLEDDFVVSRGAGPLDEVELIVVERIEPGDPALLQARILVDGIADQKVSGAELAAAMPRLRWIHSMTAGVDGLLSASLARRGILVTSGASAYAPAIAEYAFTAMTLLARDLPGHLVARTRGEWRDHELGGELFGKRLGIVGFGGIGRALARICTGAGMSVWGLRRATTGDPAPAERLLGPEHLHELLAASDFVVLAASLNPSSRGLIGRAELESMKPGAFLINVSRGALVDEDALATALAAGRLAGAMIDVTAVEPLPADSPLWKLPNLWITPHLAGGTRESRGRALAVLEQNLALHLAGRYDEMVNVVDVAHELGLQAGSEPSKGDRC
jgi:phosphoglycerate dehydrogenase-like enzyme